MAYPRQRGKSNQPPQPVPAGLWFSMFMAVALLFWWLRWPAMPIVWLGIVIAGLAAKPPMQTKKSDEPDPRQMAAYRKWKDMLAGLLPFQAGQDGGKARPNKQWTTVWRVGFWGWMLLGMMVSLNSPYPWVGPLNMLFSFWTGMCWMQYKDRKVDRRHPYQGVSISSFWTKAPMGKRIAVGVTTGVLVFVFFLAWYLEFTGFAAIWAVPASVMLWMICLLDGKRQTAAWKEQVQWQKTLDGWIADENSPMHKPWNNAYLTQVSTLGDRQNPLIVLRVRIQGDVMSVMKAGIEAIKPAAFDADYNFVELLRAKQRKQGVDTFSPNSVRLILAKDESALPDITQRSAGEKLATLMCDIAYAQVGHLFNKQPPLTTVTDVSDDDTEAAWLITFTDPPVGGDELSNIGLSWLVNEPSPGDIIHLPIHRDLFDKFHLAADPSTPLSDKGNKCKTPSGVYCRGFDENGKPNVVTREPSFQAYIDMERRYKQEVDTWTSIIGNSKIKAPEPYFDSEAEGRVMDVRAVTMQYIIASTRTVADYARLDMSALDPSAAYIGMCESSNNFAKVIRIYGMRVPRRLDQLKGPSPATAVYAKCLIYKALLNELSGSKTVTISSCLLESRDVPLWRIQIRLGGGATVADFRNKDERIRAAAGISTIYWDWQSASEATIWAMNRPYLAPEDISHFKKPATQKQLIKVALSNSWGIAGVADRSGNTPKVMDLSVLPRNHSVIKARFRIPAGLSLDKPQANLGKFLTAADYSYGRILERGDENGSDQWDMLLSKHSPFPKIVNADWLEAMKFDDRRFPLGVDDMGEPVVWDVRQTPHLAVMGKSGTGKSSLAQIPAVEALLHGYQLIIIDPSKGANDFKMWGDPRSLAFIGQGDFRGTEAAILWAEAEMGRRVRLMAEQGYQNIVDMPDEERPPRILIIFDEFNSYLNGIEKPASNPTGDTTIANFNSRINNRNASIRRTGGAMARIAVQGRTAGINMLLGAQRISGDDMDKIQGGRAFFKTLGRIMLGSDSLAGVVAAQNLSEANRLQRSIKDGEGMPMGRGIYESADGRLSAVQTWYSGGNQAIEEILADVPPVEKVDISEYLPPEADTFGEVDQQQAEQVLSESDQTISDEQIEDAEELDW
ncbi:FtsK/SpoIIIE domain-containing protein [Bifidobacterium callitrichidarum]|nr:FtsK/SpoIIIE domain-containing protein [Bifidobacterium callitrichidarum]